MQYDIGLVTCLDQWLTNDQQVAWLSFTAVPEQQSAFVPLELGISHGTQLGGLLVTNYITQPSRVVVNAIRLLTPALASVEKEREVVCGQECRGSRRRFGSPIAPRTNKLAP